MNKQIVVAVVVIGGSGVVNGIIAKKPLTPVIMGSFVLLLVLSIVDMFGGPLSTISSAIAMLAVVYILIGVDPTTKQAIFPWQTIFNILQGKKTT